MIRFTITGLSAIIASASAIQTQADASSAQWFGGYGGYNPWDTQQSYDSYSSNPFSYGDSSKVQRIEKDISYLVK